VQQQSAAAAKKRRYFDKNYNLTDFLLGVELMLSFEVV
jgi:hypothetical protein